MDKFATFSTTDRAEIFTEAAYRKGLLPQIIEKDFWVCWTLKQLFQLPEIGDHLIFKGGTSLSKIFGTINRFSEDIDVSIDRAYLGFGGKSDPAKQSSNKGRDKQIKALKKACQAKIIDPLLPLLQESIKHIIGESDWQITVDPNDRDQQTLLFEYPRDKSERGLVAINYIAPSVKIEFGARADHWPANAYSIMPYAAEIFPEQFTHPSYTIKVLEAERTFWEKATLLHGEYHRREGDPTPERLSRHYYDLHQLMNTTICANALNDLSLLDKVVEHKQTFFSSRWANYDDARTGEIHLVPQDHQLPGLKIDYDKMKEMFFGTPPSFDLIMKSMSDLEKEINSKVTNAEANPLTPLR